MAKIQIKRGLQAAVARLELAEGELAVALDTGNVYVGAAPAAHTGVAASASQLGHVKPGAEFKVGGDGSLSLSTVDGGTFE